LISPDLLSLISSGFYRVRSTAIFAQHNPRKPFADECGWDAAEPCESTWEDLRLGLSSLGCVSRASVSSVGLILQYGWDGCLGDLGLTGLS